MQPEQPTIDAARFHESLEAFKERVRAKPDDAAARFQLFEAFGVLGEWERARGQLEALARLDPSRRPAAAWFGPAIASELLRREIFAGRRTPLIFGDPEEWLGWMVAALDADGRNEHGQAQELRRRALEAVPEVQATVNGQEVAWIQDADARLGPILEAVIRGSYYWVPMSRVQRVQPLPGGMLVDRVWVTAQFTWANGGEIFGLIPTRYVNSDASADGKIQLAAVTDWVEGGGGAIIGLGHRQFGTDQGDFPLLTTRLIHWHAEAIGKADSSEAPG